MNITITLVSRPFVLYPPLDMSVLEIRVSFFQSDVFSLWMPEIVTANGHGEVHNQAKEGPRRWGPGPRGEGLRCRAVEGHVMTVESVVRDRGDHVELQYGVANVSGRTLTQIELETCYQLAAAPGFRDQTGGRTFAWADGRLANVARDGVPAECHEHHHPTQSSFLEMPDGEGGVGAIAVAGRNGGATALAWQCHGRYFGNTDPSLCCINSGPTLASLAAGERRVVRGWLGWSLGSVAELVDRARTALGSV